MEGRRFEFCKALKREYDASIEAISKETVNSLSDIVNQKLFDYYNNMPASHWVRWESRPLKGSCKLCMSLNDHIFHVKLAPSPPLHPNCKCQLVPADNETTRLIDSIDEEELKRYTITSIKQLVLGNYTEDATILGTALSILFGLTGIDIIADVRDIVYDITNWKNNWKHAGQTTIDTVSVIPVVGVIKNIKTVGKLTKKGDKLFDAVKNASKRVVKTIRTNKGNEIDITPSSNHSTTTKNPGLNGESNSSVDILDTSGNIKTRRWYGTEGKQTRDVDFTNHGNPNTHPEWPHEHGPR